MGNIFDLSADTAVITGGAGLLGSRHAIALAELGARVIITDTRLDEALTIAEDTKIKTGNHHVVALEMDVTSADSILEVNEYLRNDHTPATILVNNAAVDPKVTNDDGLINLGRFENFPQEDWDRELSVGLYGAVLCSQIFGSGMANNSGGVILNIASDLSVIAPDQRLYRRDGVADEMQPVKPVTYSVIKSGLIGLTRYLAAYWANRNVRVNALSPGGVYTSQPDYFVERLSDRIPMGRMANPDEYIGAVQFLCSPASSYMTGQNLVIDGGRSVL